MYKFKQIGTTKNLPGHGRKPTLSLRTAQNLCSKVNINQRVVLKDIAKCLDMMGISVSIQTIQHHLNRNGLYRN